MKDANKSLTDFTSANKETFDAFKSTGKVVTGAGLAISAGLGYAVKKAADFEGGMSKVAAISGTTGKELDDLTQSARDWGASTSFSATESAEALEYMALAGWNTQQMMGGIGPILHLAEAGALDLGRASDLVTDSMAGLGLEVQDLDGYLDKVATTAANSNTDIDALMEAFVIAGGTFDRFNVPLEESTAFLGVLANRGFKASEAGTAINAIMTRMTASTGPAAKAMKEIGVSAFDSEGNFRGMETVLTEVRGKLSKMTDAEKAHYQTQLAGLNHGKTFNAMIEGLGNEYGELKGKVEDSDGALLEMRNTMKDNLQGAMENLSSAFEEIAISIGTALLPLVKSMAGFVQSLADKFNGLSEGTKSTIAVILAVVAALALIIGPILLLIGFIPSILTGFAAIATVFGTTSLVLLKTIAIISGVVAVIAILVAAFVWAYNNVEWFRDGVLEVWEQIKEGFTEALEFIKGIVKTVITEVWSFIKEILGKIKAVWDNHGEAIMAVVSGTFKNIWEVIKLIMGYIKGIFQIVWPIITGIIKVAWGIIKTVIRQTMDVILGIIDAVMYLIKGDWEGAWDSIKATAIKIMNNIVKFFKEIDLKQIGKDIIKGLIKGISSMVGAAGKAVKNIATNIKNTVTSFFGINSPSRLFKGYGVNLGEGLAIGIDGMNGAVTKSAQALSESATIKPDLSYATPNADYRSLSAALSGEVNVNQRDSMLVGAIASLERKLTNLVVEMDGQKVGGIVRPHVNDGNAVDATVRRYFD